MMLDNKFLQSFLVKMKKKRLQPLQQLVPAVPVPENPPNEASTAVENSLTAFEYDDATSSHTQRTRKRPAWMQDYEVTGIGLKTKINKLENMETINMRLTKSIN